jgi:hypothetical protein
MDFDTKASNIILLVLMKNFIQMFFMKSHDGIFHMELKWYNQYIFNIWLSTSSNVVIIWII